MGPSTIPLSTISFSIINWETATWKHNFYSWLESSLASQLDWIYDLVVLTVLGLGNDVKSISQLIEHVTLIIINERLFLDLLHLFIYFLLQRCSNFYMSLMKALYVNNK